MPTDINFKTVSVLHAPGYCGSVSLGLAMTPWGTGIHILKAAIINIT